MPVDTEVVKSAFTDFEKENFVDAKEKLVQQIQVAKNDFIKNKVGLQNDIYTFSKEEEPEPELEEEPEPEPEPEPPPKPKKKVRRGLVRNREE